MEDIVAEMRSVAKPQQKDLDQAAVDRLKDLTSRLLVTRRDEAIAEYKRFVSVMDRGICLPSDRLADRVDGAVIFMTGGTGCVGSHLVQQLTKFKPARIVSVSRGLNAFGWPKHPSIEYLHGDVGDRARMDQLIGEVKPDLVFHVASQRFPGLAETLVRDTLRTNVFGTRNVLAAAANAGVGHAVCASTGKALRPFSPDIYTASKRMAEWVAHGFASSGALSCSAVRFTHVVNNSDIHKRLKEWAKSPEVVRLHSPQIMFYVQSAMECAQLMLLATLDARPRELLIHVITDLGWPISLVDLALGVLATNESDTPVYFSGYDPGYEEIPFPGLYDPVTAGDVSPLINAFEAAETVPSDCGMTDAFSAAMGPGLRAAEMFRELEATCDRTDDPDIVRAALRELSWAVLDATLEAAPLPMLTKIAGIVERHEANLIPDHQRILLAIRDRIQECSDRDLAVSVGGPH